MASEAQIQRQLLAQQRAKFARAAKDRENRERQSWEMKQEGGRRSVSKPAKASKYTPNNNRPSVGRRMGFQVLDDIVPLRKPNDPLFEWLNNAVSEMMLGTGAAATNATPQAQNENTTAMSVAKVREQVGEFFISEVPKWKFPVPSQSFNPDSGLVENMVGGLTAFPTYGGISRNGIQMPRPFPRRVDSREDMEELEGFYRKQIRDMEQAYQTRVRDLEMALQQMQRQLSDAMALQSERAYALDPATMQIVEVRTASQPKPDPKPSPAEIYLKNPPRKFRHSIKD